MIFILRFVNKREGTKQKRQRGGSPKLFFFPPPSLLHFITSLSHSLARFFPSSLPSPPPRSFPTTQLLPLHFTSREAVPVLPDVPSAPPRRGLRRRGRGHGGRPRQGPHPRLELLALFVERRQRVELVVEHFHELREGRRGS